jgi:excisionase family DNA binding protein
MKEYCGKEELAKMFNVPQSTIDYLRRKGKLPALKIGKHFRFIPSEVETSLKERSR